MMTLFLPWRQILLMAQFGHSLRPSFICWFRTFLLSVSTFDIGVKLRVIGTCHIITVIVLTGLLTALLFIGIIIDGRPLSSMSIGRTFAVYPRLKYLEHMPDFLIMILLFCDFDVRYFVGAWSKLTSCVHMGQSIGLVHILNKLKRGTIEYIFDAGLFIERVV